MVHISIALYSMSSEAMQLHNFRVRKSVNRYIFSLTLASVELYWQLLTAIVTILIHSINKDKYQKISI